MIPEPNLGNLYQEVILDHNRKPRNFKEIPDATQYSHGVNPLCGDDYHLYLKVNEGKVEDVGFQGGGCAISKSSASLMTSLIKGLLRNHFLQMMTSEREPSESEVGRMIIFKGVKEFPVRVKCATLIWHALGDALKDVSIPAQGKGQ
jgi:nitrogen fixation protein NifU and related proteins